ncbi:MAG: T9SS type A sorting domain-containing protein [Kordia sp.]|uniref:T9SS type A sorting domain-containing protein n=1 Tax=Kordia sp. TaxID=1965332 RepID=UPI00385BC8BB
MFTLHSALAQLSVRNDNYLFVKDGIFFVEDNVNLQETDSKLHLRNDAQLLQGTGTTGNSGLGQLSIYQNGTTHDYAYNYWCSPVGNNSPVLGNENFKATQFYDVTGLITSNTISFTDYNGTSSPLTIASYWIFTFENSDQYSDWFHRQDTGNIAPGLGFTMKGTSGSSNNQLYDFRGKPNNGTISNSVNADVWTLIGNPYPSAMDVVDFIHDSDNSAAITGTLYYWEQDLSVLSHYVADYVGGYATYTINSAGTVETFVPATFDTYNSDGTLNTTGSSSTSGKQARRYIPTGQGFMVEGSATTTGTVRAKNTHREYYKQSDADSEFFRPTNPNDINLIENNNTNETTVSTENTIYYDQIPAEYKRFRLNIDFNDLYTRQLVQTFHDTEATDGFDYGLESKSPSDVSSDAFWVLENEPYVAQALSFNMVRKIPLHVNLGTNHTIRVRAFDIQNFDNNQPIYLHDKETDTYTDLRTNFFEIGLPQGTYDSRFEIVFASPNSLSIDDIVVTNIQAYQNNINGQLIIRNPERHAFNEIVLYDMLGKKVITENKLQVNESYTLNTQSLSSGIYVVAIKFNNSKSFKKKIIIEN